MRRMLKVALLMGMLHFVANAYTQETPARSDDGRRLHRVSLIRIIANPGEYDGKNIRVVGYLAGAGPDDAPGVFVSESDGRNGILSNAVDLTVRETTTRGMFGKYVIVVGVYHAPPPQGDFNGYIDRVIELKPLSAGSASK